MTITNQTRQSALEAVDRIRPVLEHYRNEAEQERRLPDAVVAAIQSEGLFDLWLPREYGGDELDLLSYLQVIEELSRIDSAAGWMLANTGTGAVQAAFLPEAGAREIYGEGLLSAGSIIPRGRAVPVEGGYRLSGRWPLVSGCHHAPWLHGNSLVFEGDTPRLGEHDMPDFMLMFFPAEDASILDTWYSTGMRGTGSADIVVEDIFVPARRSFPLFTAESRLTSPLYKLRLEMHFLTVLPTVTLGVARAAIDAFLEIAKSKTPTLSQTALAARPTVHAEVARAEALYQSALAYLHQVAGEIMDAVADGPGVPDEIETRRRLACVNACEASQRVVDSMYRLGGANSIEAGSRLDRCLRDVHTLNQHLACSPVWWEKTGQSYFGLGLGMP